MKAVALDKNHYSLQINSDIKEICKPFFEQYGLSHFCYVRLYNDGSFYTLISNEDLYQHHLSKGYLIAPNINKQQLKNKFYYIVMPELEDGFNQAAYDYKNYFGLTYPIYLIERNIGYFDLYIFGSTGTGFQSINFYLSNLSLLESFKSYFHDKASSLVNKSQENKIIIPSSMKPNFQGLEISKDKSLANENRLRLLTPREKECLCFILRGKTAKEIAGLMSISFRTVEFHIMNIKEKLNCSSRSQLIEYSIDNGYLNMSFSL